MDTDAAARISLACRTEPGDLALAAAVRDHGAAALCRGSGEQLHRAAADARRWQAEGIGILTPGQPGWPTQLGDLDAAPLALFTRGLPLRAALLRSVTVVGSRSATPHGLRTGRRLSAALAQRGFTIISGAAIGIDAASHLGAMSVRGRTVAVLAAGVDVPSPARHADLLGRIARQGTIVSELPPGTRPARHRFLARNRLVAALTPGTVVVQAGQRSGALATARRAAALHRVVMAVPGLVDDPAHAGCHGLIRDGIAVLVRGPGDVAELLDPLGTAVAD